MFLLVDRDEGEEAGWAGSEFDDGIGDVFFLGLGFGVSVLVKAGKRAGEDELAPCFGEVGESCIDGGGGGGGVVVLIVGVVVGVVVIEGGRAVGEDGVDNAIDFACSKMGREGGREGRLENGLGRCRVLVPRMVGLCVVLAVDGREGRDEGWESPFQGPGCGSRAEHAFARRSMELAGGGAAEEAFHTRQSPRSHRKRAETTKQTVKCEKQ